MVTGLATVAGQPVGIVANQPSVAAGTIDIDASRKAARLVQLCDAFTVPLVTFVDTPGFQPGKDVEWRGMIRHGAELVHAYAAATAPRVSMVLPEDLPEPALDVGQDGPVAPAQGGAPVLGHRLHRDWSSPPGRPTSPGPRPAI